MYTGVCEMFGAVVLVAEPIRSGCTLGDMRIIAACVLLVLVAARMASAGPLVVRMTGPDGKVHEIPWASAAAARREGYVEFAQVYMRERDGTVLAVDSDLVEAMTRTGSWKMTDEEVTAYVAMEATIAKAGKDAEQKQADEDFRKRQEEYSRSSAAWQERREDEMRWRDIKEYGTGACLLIIVGVMGAMYMRAHRRPS